jgi:transcriptional regulator with XRE-family HTH domain
MTENNVQAASLAGRVRRARKMKEWTQAELADAAGVAPGTVNRIENAIKVRPGNLRAVMDALEIEVELTPTDAPEDADIKLICDLVAKPLRAVNDGDERRAVANDLIRYLTISRN